MSARTLPLLLVLAIASAPATAVCPAPVTGAELLSRIDQAELAYGAEDLERFRERHEALLGDLSCLSETLTRPEVARLHRLEGLAAHLERSPEDAALAFAAARHADAASALLPATIVPDDPNLPERVAFGTESLSDARWTPQPLPPKGILSFDGDADAMRPMRWPTLLQAEIEGQLVLTAYLWPDQPLPFIPTPAPPPERRRDDEPPDPLRVAVQEARPLRVTTLTVGAGGLATLTAGLIVTAGFWSVYTEQCDAIPGQGPGRRDCTRAEETQPGYYANELVPHYRVGVGLLSVGAVGLTVSGVTLALHPWRDR